MRHLVAWRGVDGVDGERLEVGLLLLLLLLLSVMLCGTLLRLVRPKNTRAVPDALTCSLFKSKEKIILPTCYMGVLDFDMHPVEVGRLAQADLDRVTLKTD